MAPYYLTYPMARKLRVVSIALVLIILTSTFVLTTASPTHENPDEAEEDLEGLFSTLRIAQKDIERSLQEALWVNYTMEEDEEDMLSDEYTREHLNRSKEIARDLKENLSEPYSVFEEIKEEEVESAEYLEEYFLPFYRISKNLGNYTRRHDYLVSNMTEAVELLKEGEDIKDLVTNSLNHFDKMNQTILPSMKENIQEIDEDIFDVSELKDLMDENHDYLKEIYETNLDELRKRSGISELTISGPNEGHPGGSVEIHGYFFQDGEFVNNANISLVSEDENISISTSNGRYRYSYNISWNQEFENISFRVEFENETANISSENLTIEIVPYSPDIELETDQQAYYEENITIPGTFETDAAIDLTEIDLNDSMNQTFFPGKDGTFNLSYESKVFRWGVSTVWVNYTGNKTISSASSNVSFEVSIPVEIEFEEHPEKLTIGDYNDQTFKGRLINVSSGEGIDLEDQENLTIFLDEKFIKNITTDEDGHFTFSIPEDINLDEGRYILKVSFEGPEKYRSVESREIMVEVEEERRFWQRPLFLVFLAASLGIISVAAYYFSGKSEEEKIEEPVEREKKPSKPSLPKAASDDEVIDTYSDLLNILKNHGIVELYRGKTHREIEKEVGTHPRFSGIRKDIRFITGLFEKALFTDRDVSSSELEEFNSSLSRVTEEVLS